MAKRRTRSNNADLQCQKFASKRSRKIQGLTVYEGADPSSSKFYRDEVEEFDKEKSEVFLTNKGRKGKGLATAFKNVIDDEEVLPVNHSDDEFSDSYAESVSDSSDNEENDNDVAVSSSSESEEDDLPSADAWGKKRSSYYDTDFVDKDYGGFSGSEEEELAFEEEREAKALQQHLAKLLCEEDFALELASFDTKGSSSSSLLIEARTAGQMPIDLSQLTDDERKRSLLLHQSPEYVGFLQELSEKYAEAKRLKPIMEQVKKKETEVCDWLKTIRLKYEIYMNYILNLQCYFLHTVSGVSLANHPLMKRINHWKNAVQFVDKKAEAFNSKIDRLLELIAKGTDISLETEFNSSTLPRPLKRIQYGYKGQQKNRSSAKNLDNRREVSDKMEPLDEKRAITFEMMKNKGLMPCRKKEQRNPRVKHKLKYRKALIKRRSQVPDVKRELTRYGGEVRGINVSVVRSIKLH